MGVNSISSRELRHLVDAFEESRHDVITDWKTYADKDELLGYNDSLDSICEHSGKNCEEETERRLPLNGDLYVQCDSSVFDEDKHGMTFVGL